MRISQAYNLSTQEAKAGGFQVQGYPGLDEEALYMKWGGFSKLAILRPDAAMAEMLFRVPQETPLQRQWAHGQAVWGRPTWWQMAGPHLDQPYGSSTLLPAVPEKASLKCQLYYKSQPDAMSAVPYCRKCSIL